MVMPLSNSLLHLTTYLKHGIQYVSVIYNVAEIFFEKKYPTQSSRTVMTTHNFARVCLHCTLLGVYEEGNNKEDIEFKNQMSTFSFPSREHLSVLPSCLYYVVSDGAEWKTYLLCKILNMFFFYIFFINHFRLAAYPSISYLQYVNSETWHCHFRFSENKNSLISAFLLICRTLLSSSFAIHSLTS